MAIQVLGILAITVGGLMMVGGLNSILTTLTININLRESRDHIDSYFDGALNLVFGFTLLILGLMPVFASLLNP